MCPLPRQRSEMKDDDLNLCFMTEAQDRYLCLTAGGGRKAYPDGCLHLYWEFEHRFVKHFEQTSMSNRDGSWHGHDSAPR